MLRRLENWVFYIFLFAIPISLRHIFGYQPVGYVEWTATYIYATDILFAALLLFWLAARLNLKAYVRSRVGDTVDRVGAGDAFFAITALAAAQSVPAEMMRTNK